LVIAKVDRAGLISLKIILTFFVVENHVKILENKGID